MLNLLVAWIGGGEIRFLQEGDLRIVSLNLSQAMNKLFGTCCAPSGSGICLTRQMVAFFPTFAVGSHLPHGSLLHEFGKARAALPPLPAASLCHYPSQGQP